METKFEFFSTAEKYCPILEAEGGLNDVQRLIDDARPYPRIKELAKIVMSNYHSYKQAQKRNQRLSEPMSIVQELFD